MHYNDHALGHFHAIYAGQDVQVRIDTLEFLEEACQGGLKD